MLQLGGEAFTIGRARYRDHRPKHPEPTAKIHVRIRIGDLPADLLATLDTGAAWTCLDPELAGNAGVLEDGEAVTVQLQTPFGRFNGRLVRVPLKILADHEQGRTLDVVATAFVASDPGWPAGRTFLGYTGLLERIRFAVDPGANYFYFGPVDGVR